MPAETLSCPMCGAPAAPDATQCDHCGARLATVACPSCFGLIFQGANFCSHCGAAVAPKEVARATEQCPRCRVAMEAIVVGRTNLEECPRCEGIWVDKDSLEQICADREQQTAVLGSAGHISKEENFETNIRYVPCPVCATLMNRVNFARCSHVIVDVCGPHGTWFDKDELRRIVEFIRAGGMDRARQKEMDELKDARRSWDSVQIIGGAGDVSLPLGAPGENYDAVELGVTTVASLLKSFLK